MYVDEAVASGAVLLNGSDAWERGGRAIADLRADWAPVPSRAFHAKPVTR